MSFNQLREEQLVTGAPNNNPYVLCEGYVGCYRFTAYACGSSIIFLSPEFSHIQSIHRPSNPNNIVCIDCSPLDGKLAVSHGNEVVVYKPYASNKDEDLTVEFETLKWHEHVVLHFENQEVMCVSWDTRAGRLLTGGETIILWCNKALVEDSILPSEYPVEIVKGSLLPMWIKKTSAPVHHLQFCPNGIYFVSAGANDRLPKLWYPRKKYSIAEHYMGQSGYDFLYLPHPRAVSSLAWRAEHHNTRTALLTSCSDNFCRIWMETSTYEELGFFCACVISSDFPESQAGFTQLPFVLHWLNVQSFDESLDGWASTANQISSVSSDTTSAVEQISDDMISGIQPDTTRDTVGLNVTTRSHIKRRRFGRSLSAYASSNNLRMDIDRNLINPGKVIQRRRRLIRAHKTPRTGAGRRVLPKIKAPGSVPPELLFFVRSDGSLAFWRVDGLDLSPRTHLVVKPLSRSPPVIPLADATSPCYRVLVHFPGLHGASRAATARRARQLRQMTNPLRNGHSVHDDNNHVYYNDSDLFPVLLELHHSSGVLAKWQVRFDPGSALSSVATVECLARCAGHTANISTVVAHPSLPCALTLAKSTHMTQIALWKVNEIGALPEISRASGLLQLGRLDIPHFTFDGATSFLPTNMFVSWITQTTNGLELFSLECRVIGSSIVTPRSQDKLIHRIVQTHTVVPFTSQMPCPFVLSRSTVDQQQFSVSFVLVVLRMDDCGRLECYRVQCSKEGKHSWSPIRHVAILGRPILVCPPSETLVMKLNPVFETEIVEGTKILFSLTRSDLIDIPLRPFAASRLEVDPSELREYAWIAGMTADRRLWVIRLEILITFLQNETECLPTAAITDLRKQNIAAEKCIVQHLPGLSLSSDFISHTSVDAIAFSSLGRVAFSMPGNATTPSKTEASDSNHVSTSDRAGMSIKAEESENSLYFSVAIFEAISNYTSWRQEHVVSLNCPVLSVMWGPNVSGADVLSVLTSDVVHLFAPGHNSLGDISWSGVARIRMQNPPITTAMLCTGAFLITHSTQLTLHSKWLVSENSSVCNKKIGVQAKAISSENFPRSLISEAASRNKTLPLYHPKVIQHIMNTKIDCPIVSGVFDQIEKAAISALAANQNIMPGYFYDESVVQRHRNLPVIDPPTNSFTDLLEFVLSSAEAKFNRTEGSKGVRTNKSDLFASPLLSDEVNLTTQDLNEAVLAPGDPLPTLLTRVRISCLSEMEMLALSGVAHAWQVLQGGIGTLDTCGKRYVIQYCAFKTLTKSRIAHGGSQIGTSTPKLLPLVMPFQDIAWALHSEAEKELLDLIAPNSLDIQDGEECLTWAQLSAAGMGWWLKSTQLLKQVIDRVMKVGYKRQDTTLLDVAIFYIASGKTKLLSGLFRVTGDTRMSEFFRNDFSSERWQTAALKNAYALLSKQRFLHAAAFFLLGGDLEGACNILLKNIHDPQLAIVVCRLCADSKQGMAGSTLCVVPSKASSWLEQILRECILPGLSESSDIFGRHIVLWHLREYMDAFDILLRSCDYRLDAKEYSMKASVKCTHISGLPLYPSAVATYLLSSHLLNHIHIRGKFKLPACVFLQASYAFACNGQPVFALEVLHEMDMYHQSEASSALVSQSITDEKTKDMNSSKQQLEEKETVDNTPVSHSAISMQDMISSGTFNFDAFSFGDDDDFRMAPSTVERTPSQFNSNTTESSSSDKLTCTDKYDQVDSKDFEQDIGLIDVVQASSWRATLASRLLSEAFIEAFPTSSSKTWQASFISLNRWSILLTQLIMFSSSEIMKNGAKKIEESEASLCCNMIGNQQSLLSTTNAVDNYPTICSHNTDRIIESGCSKEFEIITKVLQGRAMLQLVSSYQLSTAAHVAAYLEPAILPCILSHLSEQQYRYLCSRMKTQSTNVTTNMGGVCEDLVSMLSSCLQQLATGERGASCVVTPGDLVEWVVVVYVTVLLLRWSERDLTKLLPLVQRYDAAFLWQGLFGPKIYGAAQAAVMLSKPDAIADANSKSVLEYIQQPVDVEQFAKLDGLSDLDEIEIGSEVSDTVIKDDAWVFRWRLLELLIYKLVVRIVHENIELAGIDLYDLGRTSGHICHLLRDVEVRQQVLSSQLQRLPLPDVFRELALGSVTQHPANALFRGKQLQQETANPFRGILARRLWGVLIAQPFLLDIVESTLQQCSCYGLAAAPILNDPEDYAFEEASVLSVAATIASKTASASLVSSSQATSGTGTTITTAVVPSTSATITKTAAADSTTPTTSTPSPSSSVPSTPIAASAVSIHEAAKMFSSDTNSILLNSGAWNFVCRFNHDVIHMHVLQSGVLLISTSKDMFEFPSVNALVGFNFSTDGLCSANGNDRKAVSSKSALLLPQYEKQSYQRAQHELQQQLQQGLLKSEKHSEIETMFGRVVVASRPWHPQFLIPHPKYKAYVILDESSQELMALKVGDDYVLGQYTIPKEFRIAYLGFDPLGSQLFAASNEGVVYFWHFRPTLNKDPFRNMTIAQKRLDAILMLAPTVVACATESKLQFLDMLLLKSGPVIFQTASPDDGTIKHLYHSLDLHMLFCATTRGSVFLIDLEIYQRIKTISLFDTSIRCLGRLPGTLMVAIGSDLTIKVFDTSERFPTRTIGKLQSRAKLFSTSYTTLSCIGNHIFVSNGDTVFVCDILALPA